MFLLIWMIYLASLFDYPINFMIGFVALAVAGWRFLGMFDS